MTEQTEFANEQEIPTRWQKFMAWLTRLDKAINYDPLVHSVELVRHLGEKITRLESRVIELERSTRHNT